MEKFFSVIIRFFSLLFWLSIIFGIIFGIISLDINMEKVKNLFYPTTTKMNYEPSSVIDNRFYKNPTSELSLENHFDDDVYCPKYHTSTFIHKIHSGETLFSICRKYRVDIRVLIKINNLNSSKIKAGDELSIPVIIRS